MKVRRFFIGIIIFSILFFVTIIFTINEVFACFKGQGPEKEIFIPEGSGAIKIAEILKKENIISNDFLFRVYCRIKTGVNFKSGNFKIRSGLSYDRILDILNSEGYEVYYEKIVVLEGKSSFDLRDIYKNKLSIDIDEILDELNKMENISSFSFADRLGIKNFGSVYYKMEGFLFPYTFPLRKNATAKSIAIDILKKTDIEIEKLAKEAEGVNMSLWDIFTLASIIQGETSDVNEMPKVSSVFHNRLKKNMRLEADATSRYVRRLPSKIRDKYDSYKVRCLTPGPICTPTIEAIKAAMYPLKTDLYFFYADNKTGKILYAKNFDSHKKNYIS